MATSRNMPSPQPACVHRQRRVNRPWARDRADRAVVVHREKPAEAAGARVVRRVVDLLDHGPGVVAAAVASAVVEIADRAPLSRPGFTGRDSMLEWCDEVFHR